MRYVLAIVLLCATALGQAGPSCANSSTVWQLQTTANGWQWCPPSGGTATCKYNAVSKVDRADLDSAGTFAAVVTTKYGGQATWASQQNQRLKNLGYTSVGQYSYIYMSNYPAGGLPYAPVFSTSYYAMKDTAQVTHGPFHIKNATTIPNSATMKCGSSMNADALQLDPYDPGAAAAINDFIACFFTTSAPCGGPNMTRAAIVVPDEADNNYGLNFYYNHEDLGYFIAANNPMITTSPASLGGGYSYPNCTNWAKFALRDYLKSIYPAVANLNTAWGTSYTTFDSSEASGLAHIAACTYSSYGTGTGFLDDAGTDLIVGGFNCSGVDGNGPSSVDTWEAVAQIKTDVHAFIGQFAALYASLLRTGYNAACGSACPPEFLPLYDPPTYVASGAAPYIDGLWAAPAYTATPAVFISHIQTLINNLGGKPLIAANYFRANPDDYVNVACDNGGGFGAGEDCTTTEAARATNITSVNDRTTGSLSLKNPGGKYAVVGIEHWSLYDSHGEARGFGLFSPNDNIYDGSQATTDVSSPACLTSHAYMAPTICSDGTNKQSLRVGSCTSGGSAPTWSTAYYGQTTDGTCLWFNIGVYALTAEVSNWGNAMGPVADQNLTSLCDPPFGGSNAAPGTSFIGAIK